jgi:predicted MPP superfamily phosphohydrolase
MRIVHLSDIHLDEGNYDKLRKKIILELIIDLKKYNEKMPIDLIIITGDLVDQGGHSLKKVTEFKEIESPFEIFEKLFIEPISKELNISKDKFLFVPGNHDIDNSNINVEKEMELRNLIDESKTKIRTDIDGHINNYLYDNRANFNEVNNRIKSFKDFEKKYHENILTKNYIYSNNESIFIYEYDKFKIGFLLLNDSWRCSSELKDSLGKDLKFDKKYHFIGTDQFYKAIEFFDKEKTNLNILLHHHPLEDYVQYDDIKEEFFLKQNKKFDLTLYGHLHESNLGKIIYEKSELFSNQCRAGLYKPDETDTTYKPGYNIIDFDLHKSIIERVHYRIYNKDMETERKMFIPDEFNTRNEHGVFDNDKKGFLLNLRNLDEVKATVVDLSILNELNFITEPKSLKLSELFEDEFIPKTKIENNG